MSDILVLILSDIVAVILGIFVGKKLFQRSFEQKEQEAHARAAEIIKTAESNAETIKKDRILEAKEKYLRLKSEFEEDSTNKSSNNVSRRCRRQSSKTNAVRLSCKHRSRPSLSSLKLLQSAKKKPKNSLISK